MADDAESDDQWLYGDASDIPNLEPPGVDSPPPQKPRSVDNEKHNEDDDDETNDDKQSDSQNDGVTTPPPRRSPPVHLQPPGTGNNGQFDDLAPPGTEDDLNEEEKQNGDGSDKDDSEEDSDDDVNVVIGDIKTSPAYTSLNIKRGGLLTSTVVDKSKQIAPQTGKFTVEEFDQIGMINGVNAAEYNMDGLEDKPWRKPGADITDYFNYGFNEDTWKAYCERQKRMRVNESGVGLVPLNSIGLPRGPIQIMNDNSKYSSGGQYYGGGGGGFVGGFGSGGPLRKAGPPPARSMTGAIDVIGGPALPGSKMMDAPKENIIQVMTADRREYSRKPPGYPDMSMPPPNFEEFQPEFGFNPEPEPFYGGYEPTQDVQWAGSSGNQAWAPSEIKPLTPGPGMVPAPVPPVMVPPSMAAPAAPLDRVKDSPPAPRRDSRDREMSRSRSEKPRDRDRERSHRRERSRSRSRRHRSRSRSPSHRHKKKKSRRHEDSD